MRLSKVSRSVWKRRSSSNLLESTRFVCSSSAASALGSDGRGRIDPLGSVTDGGGALAFGRTRGRGVECGELGSVAGEACADGGELGEALGELVGARVPGGRTLGGSGRVDVISPRAGGGGSGRVDVISPRAGGGGSGRALPGSGGGRTLGGGGRTRGGGGRTLSGGGRTPGGNGVAVGEMLEPGNGGGPLPGSGGGPRAGNGGGVDAPGFGSSTRVISVSVCSSF